MFIIHCHHFGFVVLTEQSILVDIIIFKDYDNFWISRTTRQKVILLSFWFLQGNQSEVDHDQHFRRSGHMEWGTKGRYAFISVFEQSHFPLWLESFFFYSENISPPPPFFNLINVLSIIIIILHCHIFYFYFFISCIEWSNFSVTLWKRMFFLFQPNSFSYYHYEQCFSLDRETGHPSGDIDKVFL